MTDRMALQRRNKGQARILEAVVAALLIFIVFTGSSFLVNRLDTTSTQERTDLDRLGYNVLSKLTESRTIEATIENNATSQIMRQIELKNFIRSAVPSSMLFSLDITEYGRNETWVMPLSVMTISNADGVSFSNSLTISSTPTLYTSKNGNIYYLVLILASGKGGA